MPHMEKIIRRANRLIAISENTKMDIVNLFKIDPGKIDVIYHGYNAPEKKNSVNKLGRYILFVGKRCGYKNFTRFAKAASILMNKDRDLKLICAGMPFTTEEISELKTLNILSKTKVFGVSEEGLNNLYAHARAFVYPSLYEGFGMPILEAFANNCPVCLSNTSSMPEVAGDAGIYFDPKNEESILNAIEKVIYDTDFSERIITAGNDRLKKFSWKFCAEQTTNSYFKTLS
jgi:glycosyltransferase involved in cell wall biosynthesis